MQYFFYYKNPGNVEDSVLGKKLCCLQRKKKITNTNPREYLLPIDIQSRSLINM